MSCWCLRLNFCAAMIMRQRQRCQCSTCSSASLHTKRAPHCLRTGGSARLQDQWLLCDLDLHAWPWAAAHHVKLFSSRLRGA